MEEQLPAYGQTVNTSGSATQNVRLPGQYADASTSLYDNGFRTYSEGPSGVSPGRYMQADPIGLNGGLNPYRYAASNPWSWIDPDGLVEGSPKNIAKRKKINEIAKSFNGSTKWSFGSNNGLDHFAAPFQYPANSWKCSEFVCDATSLADAPMRVEVKNKERCPTAGELANKHWDPEDWRILDDNEMPQPGDVAAYPMTGQGYTGHTGIVTDNAEGNTAAHEDSVYGQSGQFTENPKTINRRYTGE